MNITKNSIEVKTVYFDNIKPESAAFPVVCVEICPALRELDELYKNEQSEERRTVLMRGAEALSHVACAEQCKGPQDIIDAQLCVMEGLAGIHDLFRQR